MILNDNRRGSPNRHSAIRDGGAQEWHGYDGNGNLTRHKKKKEEIYYV